MAAGGGAVERRLRATLGGCGGGDGGAVSHRARPCQSRAAQPPPQSATRGGRGWTAQAQKRFWPGRPIPLTVGVSREELRSGAQPDVQTRFWSHMTMAVILALAPSRVLRPGRQE